MLISARLLARTGHEVGANDLKTLKEHALHTGFTIIKLQISSTVVNMQENRTGLLGLDIREDASLK